MKKSAFRRDRFEEVTTAFAFLLPFFALWALWFFMPLMQSVSMSLYEFSFVKPDATRFVGLGNYARLFGDGYFWQAVRNTLMFVVVTVPAVSIISLPVAFMLNMKIRARSFFRVVCYIPNVISQIAVATLFMYLFVRGALLAKAFSHIGFPNTTWFTDVKLAMPFIMIIYVWQFVGFYVVIYLSGLQTIPEEIYESARIDGATGSQTFFKITIPMMKPIIMFAMTYSVIASFQVFDQIAAVSNNRPLGSPAGATSTMVTFFYSNAFRYYEMGYGCAGAVVLFLLILFVSVLQKKIIGSDDI